MNEGGEKKSQGMTPEEAARAVQPRTTRTGTATDPDADPREALGEGQPESSAQKSEPPVDTD